jgi:ABC-type transport system involved in cytochrome bd biosynthesis fused ATPase/permease subunit
MDGLLLKKKLTGSVPIVGWKQWMASLLLVVTIPLVIVKLVALVLVIKAANNEFRSTSCLPSS